MEYVADVIPKVQFTEFINKLPCVLYIIINVEDKHKTRPLVCSHEMGMGFPTIVYLQSENKASILSPGVSLGTPLLFWFPHLLEYFDLM